MKCSGARALSSFLPSPAPEERTFLAQPPARVCSGARLIPLGCWILLGGALQPGHGGRRGIVGVARWRRGWHCPGTRRWARAGGSPRRLGRCSSCERATPPSLLQQWLVRETRAGSVPFRCACILRLGFTTVLGENGCLD